MGQQISEPLADIQAVTNLKHCESPIERLLVAALQAYATIRRRTLNWETGRGTVDFSVTPQHAVATSAGNYRLDVLVRLQRNGETWNVGVECDGHDFHERTKEQAARDKARDRALKLRGFDVIRFTGSEIARYPRSCAQEALAIMGAQVPVATRGRPQP